MTSVTTSRVTTTATTTMLIMKVMMMIVIPMMMMTTTMMITEVEFQLMVTGRHPVLKTGSAYATRFPATQP